MVYVRLEWHGPSEGEGQAQRWGAEEVHETYLAHHGRPVKGMVADFLVSQHDPPEPFEMNNTLTKPPSPHRGSFAVATSSSRTSQVRHSARTSVDMSSSFKAATVISLIKSRPNPQQARG